MTRGQIKGNLRKASLMALAGLFAACGGGGGGGGFENGEDASGIWLGTMDIDGGANNPYQTALIVQSNGKFILNNSIQLFIGDASTELTAFTGDGKGYPYAASFVQDQPVEMLATVHAGATLVGSYLGQGHSGTYNLTYDAGASARNASLANLVGTWGGSLLLRGTGIVIPLTFAADGTFTGTSVEIEGCSLTGKVSVPNPDENIYKWSVKTKDCVYSGDVPVDVPANGFGYFYQNGGEDRFYFAGLSNGIIPVIFTGSK